MQPLHRRGGGGTPLACNRTPPNLLYVHVLTISQSFAITMEMQKTHEGYRYRMDRVLVGGNTSFRCISRNCYGRMKINATGEIVSLNEHRQEREYAEKHPPECPVSMKMVVPFNTSAKPQVDVEDKAVKDKDNCNIEMLVLDTVPKRCKSQAAKIALH